jgi:hypothetical protein
MPLLRHYAALPPDDIIEITPYFHLRHAIYFRHYTPD